MHFGVRENPKHCDNLDYDNDNENGVTGGPESNCLTY